ncbi:alpha/beta fold hydrolase [Undibacterium sp. Ji67W]|uniref:alpha/beta fold hydrolase n=1 Tax=Undibacterium sp. Ji67W TaxID=3413042 RepID=UPI003BEFAC7F
MMPGRNLTAINVALSAATGKQHRSQLSSAHIELHRHYIALKDEHQTKISYLKSDVNDGTNYIFVHGTPGDARTWTNYILDPVSNTKTIALDRPGFGHSEPEDCVPDLGQQAKAVRSLFPDDGSQVVLVGHSLGGAIVSLIAAECPDQVKGLVLLAASLDPLQEQIHPLQTLGNTKAIRTLLPRPLRNANTELLGLKPQLVELQPMLKNITAKTIIVHGTKDDLVPYANVSYIQKHFISASHLEVFSLEGVNHFLPRNSEPVIRHALIIANSSGV